MLISRSGSSLDPGDGGQPDQLPFLAIHGISRPPAAHRFEQQQDQRAVSALVSLNRCRDPHADLPVQSIIVVGCTGANASSSFNSCLAPMTPGSGDISSMYALSHVGGASDFSSAIRGPTGNTASKSFTPSKPGDGLCTFAVERHAAGGPWSPPN